MDYSTWGRRESDTTERLHFHILYYRTKGRHGSYMTEQTSRISFLPSLWGQWICNTLRREREKKYKLEKAG